MWPAIRAGLGGVFILYFLLCAALFAFQRSLIYFPQPTSGDKVTFILHTGGLL